MPSNRLNVDQILEPDQELFSDKNGFRLILQGDGNLVLYDSANSGLWASETTDKAIKFAKLQGDGNLVLFYHNLKPAWDSKSKLAAGQFDPYLMVTDDGQVRVYATTSIWSVGKKA